MSDDILQMIQDKDITTINNSRYLLMEMPITVKPINMFNIIFNLRERNFVPIIAHPERYTFIQSDPFIIYQMICNGCLAQSNYGSILGNYGEKAKILVKKLLEANMVHFLVQMFIDQKQYIMKFMMQQNKLLVLLEKKNLKN